MRLAAEGGGVGAEVEGVVLGGGAKVGLGVKKDRMELWRGEGLVVFVGSDIVAAALELRS